MKKLFLLAAVILGFAFPANAHQGAGHFKLSLWDNIAVAIPHNIYDIKGLDLGIGSKANTVTGVQWDLIWADASHLTGASLALVTRNSQTTGAQLGAINLSEAELIGAQLGFYNQANYVTGVQIGLVNYAKQLYGLQLGILNIAENGYLPAMIFINGRF